MDIYGILAIIGGLVLFLYGITTLGEGLKKVSGGKMEDILQTLTSNKWKGALLGSRFCQFRDHVAEPGGRRHPRRQHRYHDYGMAPVADRNSE